VRRSGTVFFASAFVVTLIVAVALSQLASSQPDGLEYVAQKQGFAAQERQHALGGGPLAGYGENLQMSDRMSTAVAGLAGVVATLALGLGVLWLARAPHEQSAQLPSSSSGQAGGSREP